GLVAAAGANRDDLALGGLFLGGIGNDDAAGGLLFGIDALDDNAVVKRTKLHDVLLKLLTEFKICVGGPQQRASLCRSFQARHRGHFLGPQEAPKKDLALADWECQAKSGTRLIRVPPSTLRPRAGEDPLARLSALLSQCCYRLDFGNFIQFLSLFVWEVISRLDVRIGGRHGISAIGRQRIGFQGLPPPARRLWSDHGANPLPTSRSSVPAADLCLAGLRPLPAVSRAQPLSRLLAGDARGAAALGHGRACPPDQAGRNPLHQRRIPSALTSA